MFAFLSAWLRHELFFRHLAFGLVVAGAVSFVWIHVSMIWTPFVVGLSAAYVANMPVSWLERHVRIPRLIGSICFVGLFIILTITFVMWSVPLLVQQMRELAMILPTYFELLSRKIQPLLKNAHGILSLQPNWHQYAADMGREVIQFFMMCISNSMVLANLFVFIVLTPIVFFYALNDWQSWKNKAKNVVHSSFFLGLIRSVDRHLVGFLKGQSLVCLVVFVMHTTLFWMWGFKSSYILGASVGFCAFIPYGTVCSSIIGSAIVAVNQMGAEAPLVAIWFSIGFLIALENYVLIPNFVGRRIGLHPIMVLFSFLMCVSTLGFKGALVAMPLSAAIWGAIRYCYNHSLMVAPDQPQKQ